MVSMVQMETCMALKECGYVPVGLPQTINTPIPGLILFTTESHGKLLVVQPDGTTVDLLDVWHLAERALRHTRAFPPEYDKLTDLIVALNGKNPPSV